MSKWWVENPLIVAKLNKLQSEHNHLLWLEGLQKALAASFELLTAASAVSVDCARPQQGASGRPVTPHQNDQRAPPMNRKPNLSHREWSVKHWLSVWNPGPKDTIISVTLLFHSFLIFKNVQNWHMINQHFFVVLMTEQTRMIDSLWDGSLKCTCLKNNGWKMISIRRSKAPFQLRVHN